MELGKLPATIQNVVTLYLILDGVVHFEIDLNMDETLKDNVFTLIFDLKELKKDIHMLTGDSKASALQAASSLKIPRENCKYEVTTYEKENYIKHLIEDRNKKVMMIGDGINDIKAFKMANLSCTINFKSSQNLSFSSFVIIDNDVLNISGLFRLSRYSDFFKKLILFCSLLYNFPVIMASSGVTEFIFGYSLPAFMAAWAMFLSSIVLTMLSNLMECVEMKNYKRKNAKKSNK